MAIETAVDPALAYTDNVHRAQLRPKKCIDRTQHAACEGDDEAVGRHGETFEEWIVANLEEIRLMIKACRIDGDTSLDQEADHRQPTPHAIRKPFWSHGIVLRDVPWVSILAGWGFWDA